MRGMIYAVSPEGVIGLDGKIPWNHPGDMGRFLRVTLGTTVIMGRGTFEERGRALPGRRNIVVTSRPLDAPDVETARSVDLALALAGDAEVWFIGGAGIYAEAARVADVIDVTYVPDHVEDPRAVKAPPIDERLFSPGPLLPHENEPSLQRRVYTRVRAGAAAIGKRS